MTTKVGTMTNEERLQKTIRLEKTDKILSDPAVNAFPATYNGMTVKEFFNSPEKAEEAYERTFNDFGGWDVIRPGAGRGDDGGVRSAGSVMQRLLPGKELRDNVINQNAEYELMLPEDYDFVIENGFNALQDRLIQRTDPGPGLSPEVRQRLAAEANIRLKAIIEKWEARGLVRVSGGSLGGHHPFSSFSQWRSLPKFSMDIRRIPDRKSVV